MIVTPSKEALELLAQGARIRSPEEAAASKLKRAKAEGRLVAEPKQVQ